MRRIMWGVLLAAVTGCAGSPTTPTPDSVALALPERARTATACGEERVAQEVIMHLQLIEDMNRQGKYHAALAHLDALGARGEDLPRAQFLRAEASRQVGDHATARRLFTVLTKGCLAGLGHHGLARLAMDAGRTAEGLAEFAAAVRERPTDPLIRNDYGYALLLAGLVRDARHQFQTAHELGGGDQVAANLLLALLVDGDQKTAAALADRLALSAAERDEFATRAAALRTTLPAATPPTEERDP